MDQCSTDRTTFDSGGGGLAWRQRLVAENERLRRQCDQTQALVSRHALMLREGDHRIKNSLQIVASLMGLQASRETTASARNALNAAASRVQSIAQIHNALQQNAGEDLVNLGTVLETICQSLHAMAGDPGHVSVIVKVAQIRAPVGLAQPIVLAVNELVVNALRHAFPEDRPGTVEVSVEQVGNELRIVVSDNGRGLPADHVEGRGYGMKLVRMMADQIGGSLTVDSTAGASFALIAPAPAPGVS